jgi:nucleotide-binding universal stress UspA family protein
MLVAATDLSSRSDRALHRAALIARQFKSRLALLHVVDDDQPSELVAEETRKATKLLDGHAGHLAKLAASTPNVLVRHGDPFQAIVGTAKELGAELIVMGAHRKRILRDVFVGTTIERVMRTGRIPVLMVNAHPSGPYRRMLLAVDISEASSGVVQAVKSLGLLSVSKVWIMHAFRSYAKAMLDRIGASREEVTTHVAKTAADARRELDSFLQREGLEDRMMEVLLEEGNPFSAISRTVKLRNPDLLVIGTRGQAGLKRMFLGSVADEVLRRTPCDVLAVPAHS